MLDIKVENFVGDATQDGGNGESSIDAGSVSRLQDSTGFDISHTVRAEESQPLPQVVPPPIERYYELTPAMLDTLLLDSLVSYSIHAQQKGDLRWVVIIQRKLVERNPNYLKAHLVLCGAFIELGEFEEARKEHEVIVALARDMHLSQNIRLWVEGLGTAIAKAEAKAAAEALREKWPMEYSSSDIAGIAECPEYILIQYAKQAFQRSDWEAVIFFRRELIRRNSSDPINYIFLSIAFEELGRLEEALEARLTLDRLITNPQDRLKNMDRITHLRRKISAQQEAKWPADYRALGDVNIADCPARALATYATQARAAEDYESACRFEVSVAAMEPRDIGAHVGLARDLERLDKYDEALFVRGTLQDLLLKEGNPANVMQNERCIVRLRIRRERLQMTEKIFPDDYQKVADSSLVICADPRRIAEWAKQAIAAKDWTKAIKFLNKLVALQPINVEAHFRLAECLMEKGDTAADIRLVMIHDRIARLTEQDYSSELHERMKPIAAYVAAKGFRYRNQRPSPPDIYSEVTAAQLERCLDSNLVKQWACQAMDVKNYREAVKFLRKLVLLRPQDFEAYVLFAEVLIGANKFGEELINTYDRIAYFVAQKDDREKDFKERIRAIQDAIARNPSGLRPYSEAATVPKKELRPEPARQPNDAVVAASPTVQPEILEQDMPRQFGAFLDWLVRLAADYPSNSSSPGGPVRRIPDSHQSILNAAFAKFEEVLGNRGFLHKGAVAFMNSFSAVTLGLQRGEINLDKLGVLIKRTSKAAKSVSCEENADDTADYVTKQLPRRSNIDNTRFDNWIATLLRAAEDWPPYDGTDLKGDSWVQIPQIDLEPLNDACTKFLIDLPRLQRVDADREPVIWHLFLALKTNIERGVVNTRQLENFLRRIMDKGYIEWA